MSQNTDEDAKGEVEMATKKSNADTKSSAAVKERKNRKEKSKALAKVSQSIFVYRKLNGHLNETSISFLTKQ